MYAPFHPPSSLLFSHDDSGVLLTPYSCYPARKPTVAEGDLVRTRSPLLNFGTVPVGAERERESKREKGLRWVES